MSVLITGGAGYIGSHTCVELLNNGYEVVVVDNLSNSDEKAIKNVTEITGKSIKFYKNDLRNKDDLERIFKNESISSVIHFAGLKAIGESVEKPLEYYENNISGTINLLSTMKKYNVKNLVFSSSATVYGAPDNVPITENFPLSVTNPYGRTKLMQEEIFRDLYTSDKNWGIMLLRYFNPIGAHKSGLIGENPRGIPNNLLPYISQVALGNLPYVKIYGNDYGTRDGTGVRDYIHVVDLAKGHLKAIEKLESSSGGIHTYNLGTGRGYSVLEVLKTFERISGKNIKYKFEKRRAGDIGECYADCSLAKKELNWEAENDIEEMCKDAWRWQTLNPNGY